MASEAVNDNLTPVSAESEHAELNRLFLLYRLANLNQRYYGCRAEKYERYGRWLDLASAAASAVALFLLLLFEAPPQADWARRGAAVLAGLTAISMALAPVTQWANQAKRFIQLHALYGNVFSDIGAAISNIKREGFTSESLGASKLVHESMRRLHSLDELEPDTDLIDRETKKVEEAFPSNYVWTNF